MADPKPVVPTLHNISTPVLTNLSDQLAYLVRWFFANPGGTSSNNEEELISFRKMNSLYGKNPGEMCERVADALETICRRYTSNVKVDCSYKMEEHRSSEDIDPVTGRGILQGNYKMDISITDKEGEPIIPHRTIQIMNNGDTIDLTFKNRS